MKKKLKTRSGNKVKPIKKLNREQVRIKNNWENITKGWKVVKSEK